MRICRSVARAADRHRLLAGEAGRVLEHVGQRPLQLVGVRVQRRAARGRAGGRSPRRARERSPCAAPDHLVHADPVLARLNPPGLEPAEVEQVVHQAREPPALGGDHGGELAPLLLRQRLRAQPARGGRDRRERRAQVVRDRPQERRLHHVRAPQRLRLDHLRLELLAPAHGGHERLEARNHAVLERVEHLALGGRGHEHGPDAAARHDQRKRAPALVAVRPARARSTPRAGRRRGDALAGRPERVLHALLRRAAGAPARRTGPPRGCGARPPPPGTRAAPASVLVTTAATRNTASAEPVLALGDREAAGGRYVEEVERQGAEHAPWRVPSRGPSSSTPAAPRACRPRRWRAPARSPGARRSRR